MVARSVSGFPQLGSIDAVYRHLEDYLGWLGQSGHEGAALHPMDAYLLHLVLEFSPRPAFVLDLSCGLTAGASTVVALANARAARVIAYRQAHEGPPGSPTHWPEALARYAEDATAAGRLELASEWTGDGREGWAAALGSVGPGDTPVVLVDARTAAGHAPPDLELLFELAPGALVMVFGVGRLGESDIPGRIAGRCPEGSPLRLRLLREAAPALGSSRLALISRREDPTADRISRRIEELYATNFDFLTLARDSCLFAVERGAMEEFEREAQEKDREMADLRQQLSRRNMEIQDRDRRLDEQAARLLDLGRIEAEREGLCRRVEELATVEADRQRLAAEVDRLVGEAADRQRLAAEVVRLGDDLWSANHRLNRERTRPILKTAVLYTCRQAVGFGRRHRSLVAPPGSARERWARALMRGQRSIRGQS